MATREPTITLREPTLSSTWPKATVARPATRFAATPKARTMDSEKPKATPASTPPKAKIPASPSRKTAEETRNHTMERSVAHSRLTERTRSA